MDRLPLKDLTRKDLRKIPCIKNSRQFFPWVYCLAALCLVSNTYRLMHRSANIKNYFEDIFWLQAVAALDPPDIDHQCSTSGKHSRTNFTSVPEEAYCLSIPGSFRGDRLNVDRSDCSLFAIPWFGATPHRAAPQERSCCLQSAAGNTCVCFQVPTARVALCVRQHWPGAGLRLKCVKTKLSEKRTWSLPLEMPQNTTFPCPPFQKRYCGFRKE